MSTEVKFSTAEAFRYAIESVKKRFTRALITALSIVLGIAFMVALLTLASIVRYAGEEATGASGAIEAYQAWMVVIALIVCGVGIVNSMLMAVTERYKEIGTLKCLGALNTHILLLFLFESSILGIIGGVVGAIGGWGSAIVIYGFGGGGFADVFLVPMMEQLSTIGLAIGLSIFLSVISAAYPAYRAASLDPADALRYVA